MPPRPGNPPGGSPGKFGGGRLTPGGSPAGISGGGPPPNIWLRMPRFLPMALIMSAPVLIAVYHRDLFTLAENIVISQGQEIRQMDAWLQSWYGLQLPLDGMAMSVPTPTTMAP